MQKYQMPIEGMDTVLRDVRRNKDLPLHLTYPQANARFPIIIFSHGAGGSGQLYQYLARYWASRGFVVIQPTHDDSIALNQVRKTRRSFAQTMRQLPTNGRAWIDRAKDVSFVIDSLRALEQSESSLRNKTDEQRIGVGGHSLGSFTALLLAGARIPANGNLDEVFDVSVSDARIRGIVAMSPQGIRLSENSLGFDDASAFANVTLPALFLTGDRDVSIWNSEHQRAEPFKFSAASDKYLVTISGANHMTFVGDAGLGQQGSQRSMRTYGHSLWSAVEENSSKPAAVEDEQALRKVIQGTSTLFWGAYLKQDEKALAAIAGGSIQKLVGCVGEVLQR